MGRTASGPAARAAPRHGHAPLDALHRDSTYGLHMHRLTGYGPSRRGRTRTRERPLLLDMRVIFVDILPGKNAAVHEERKAPVCPPSARV
jgi:hypothetical protein